MPRLRAAWLKPPFSATARKARACVGVIAFSYSYGENFEFDLYYEFCEPATVSRRGRHETPGNGRRPVSNRRQEGTEKTHPPQRPDGPDLPLRPFCHDRLYRRSRLPR